MFFSYGGEGLYQKKIRKLVSENSNIQLAYDEPSDARNLSPSQIDDLLKELKSAMQVAAKNLDFEELSSSLQGSIL
mgnify:CR=1 FL=1